MSACRYSALYLAAGADRPRRVLPLAGAVLCAAMGSAAVLQPPPASAQEPGAPSRDAPLRLNIPAGPLDEALGRFGRQAGVLISASAAVTEGLRTQGLSGEYTLDEALRRLLAGTGLVYRFVDSETVAVEAPAASEGVAVDPITVSAPAGLPAPAADPRQGYRAEVASSATRSALPLLETPAAIGVVTDDALRDTAARSQGDALELVSGVSRGNRRLGRAEGINIRGFQANTFFDSFNGVRTDGLASDGLFAPDPALIERYEVLKGPDSVRGGATPPGGFVNRVLKRPQDGRFAVADLERGSFDLYRASLDANGPLSGDERLRGRLVVAAEDGGEFVDGIDARQFTAAPMLEADVLDGAGTLFLRATVQDFDGSSYPGIPFLSSGEAPDIPPERLIGGGTEDGAETRFEGEALDAGYDHRFVNGLELTARARRQQSDLTSLDLYAYQYGGIDPDGDTSIYAGLREVQLETVTGELYLRRETDFGGVPGEWLAGLDHRDQREDFRNAFQFLGTENIFDPQGGFTAPTIESLRASPAGFRTETLEQTGAYAQAVLRPGERLTLLGALRYDRADVANRERDTGEVSRDEPSEVTGRLGASLAVTPSANVYASYTQSFQPQIATTVEGDLLPPETGESYEVGAKLDLLDGRLGLTAAVFRTYRRDVATADPDNRFFSVATGEQRHGGVELDVTGRPLPGLELIAALSWTDAEITESNDGFEGFSPERIPVDYVARLHATYAFQGEALRGFGIGGGVLAHSGYHLDNVEEVTSDAYERWDAVAFYRPSEALDVTLTVRNLTDERYIEAPGGVNAFNQFGAPRSVLASARLRF